MFLIRLPAGVRDSHRIVLGIKQSNMNHLSEIISLSCGMWMTGCDENIPGGLIGY